MALFLPVLLLLLLQRTAAQNGTVCPGYPVDAIGAVTKAAAVPVCFRVVDGAVQSFRPHVDQFTLLKMHTGNISAVSAIQESRLSVQIGGAVADHIYIQDSRVVPFLVVTAFTRNGIVESLLFDDTTSGCEPSDILGVSCSIPMSSCDKNDCSPKVYISWIGTDSDGAVLKSAELRPSRFMQYSGASVFSSLASAL